MVNTNEVLPDKVLLGMGDVYVCKLSTLATQSFR